MPIAMNREAVVDALAQVDKEELSHYDLFCPKCRTMNRVSRKQLQRAAPKVVRDEGDAK